jgi:CBS domain-containing protein
MHSWQTRILKNSAVIKNALAILDEIGVVSNVLFVVDENGRLLGSVTDGDIRRGLLRDASVKDGITTVMNPNCKRLIRYQLDNAFIDFCRREGIRYVPVVDDNNKSLTFLISRNTKKSF